MNRQLTKGEIVMVLGLAAILIGFVVLAVPFGSQRMDEGSLVNLFAGNDAGQDRAISSDAAGPAVGIPETRFIYAHEERAIPRPAGEDLEAFFSPEDAIDKTPSWIIESHKERWASVTNSDSEPSAAANAEVTGLYSSVVSDSGSPDYLNMHLLQQYNKDEMAAEASSDSKPSTSANGEVTGRYSSVVNDNGTPDYLNFHLLRQYEKVK